MGLFFQFRNSFVLFETSSHSISQDSHKLTVISYNNLLSASSADIPAWLSQKALKNILFKYFKRGSHYVDLAHLEFTM